MGQQVPNRARTGLRSPIAPGLSFGGIGAGLIEVIRAIVEDLAEPSLLDPLHCQCYRGHAAIVEPDEVGKNTDGLRHLCRLFNRKCQRLFA